MSSAQTLKKNIFIMLTVLFHSGDPTPQDVRNSVPVSVEVFFGG